jgi:hypothetical protein
MDLFRLLWMHFTYLQLKYLKCFCFLFSNKIDRAINNKYLIYICFLDKVTNCGKEFILGFPAQYFSSSGGYIGMSIVAHLDANVSILTRTSESPLNVTFHMKKGESLHYSLPSSLRMQSKQTNGILVSSTTEISLMCLNYHSSYYGDAYLALPTHALGITYIVPSYKPYDGNSRAKIGIISTHDKNKILIQPNRVSTIQYDGTWYNHGNPLQVSLDRLQSIQLTSTSDLSGTVIYATKPISVVSSVDRARIGNSGLVGRLDSFLSPVSQWGQHYILTTIGSAQKSRGDVFRVFAYENNTVIKSGNWTKVLSLGMHVEISLDETLASFVNCSKPCQVTQYTRGERNGCRASMIVLPSVKHYLPYYRIVSSYTSNFYSSVIVTIEERHTNGLFINGLKGDNLDWMRVTGTKYVWTVVGTPGTEIATFYHSSPEIIFGMLAFGWNNDISYAYPGGVAFEHHTTGRYNIHASTFMVNIFPYYERLIDFTESCHDIFRNSMSVPYRHAAGYIT